MFTHLVTLFEDVHLINKSIAFDWLNIRDTYGLNHYIPPPLPLKSLFSRYAKSRYTLINQQKKLFIALMTHMYIKVNNNKHPDSTCKNCTPSRTKITPVLSNMF